MKGMLMYFLYGIVESIGYLSDDEKKRYLNQGRSRSSSQTPSTASPSFASSSSSEKPETFGIEEESIDKNVCNDINLDNNENNAMNENNTNDLKKLELGNNQINSNDSDNQLVKEDNIS
jgi:hypothetical protein